jgi:hypothetical protein
MRFLGACLVIAMLTACGSEHDEKRPEPLDQRAKIACAAFDELAATFKSLNEDERRALVIEMWNSAQLSETTGIRRVGRKVFELVSEERVAARAKTFDEMHLACKGLASPYRTIGSND